MTLATSRTDMATKEAASDEKEASKVEDPSTQEYRNDEFPIKRSSEKAVSKVNREFYGENTPPNISSWERESSIIPSSGAAPIGILGKMKAPVGSLSSLATSQSPQSIVRKKVSTEATLKAESEQSYDVRLSPTEMSDSDSRSLSEDTSLTSPSPSDTEQLIAKDGAGIQPNDVEPNDAQPNDVQQDEIMVAIAGKSGAGKSTLINNLLQRDEDIELTPDSTTEKLENQTIRIENEDVTINIIDTPGLKEERAEKIKQLRELFDFTKGKADLLVYCIPVGPGFKFNNANPTIMKSLQRVFGKKVWRHCVVVFTFSNQAWEKISASNNNQEVETIAKYKDYIKKYTERFQEMLVKLKVTDVAVRSIFDLPPHPRNKEEGFTIVTVPAGKSLEDRVLADKDVDYENWRSAVFLEMISGCKDNKKKPFLECWYGRKRVKETLENIKQVALGSSGAGVMVVSGTVIGATAGLGGGPLGMLIGGTLGAAAGIVASIVMGGGVVAHQT